LQQQRKSTGHVWCRHVSSLRILVVDDDADSGDSLALLLRLSGHDVRVVDSGRAALSAVKEFRPRFVLLDIGMPDMDGYAVAQHLRKDGHVEQPVLIAVTGYTQADHLERARAVGIDHHLCKPVDMDALSELLAR
jgi:two-component system CheB/CheR fusion protein